jgi:hypothetical protein
MVQQTLALPILVVSLRFGVATISDAWNFHLRAGDV